MDITAFYLLALAAIVVLVAVLFVVLFVVLFKPGLPHLIRGDLPVCDSHESRRSASLPGCQRGRLTAKISLGARACWRRLSVGAAPGRATQIGRMMKDAAGWPIWLAEVARAVDICQPEIESGSDNFQYGVYGHFRTCPVRRRVALTGCSSPSQLSRACAVGPCMGSTKAAPLRSRLTVNDPGRK